MKYDRYVHTVVSCTPSDYSRPCASKSLFSIMYWRQTDRYNIRRFSNDPSQFENRDVIVKSNTRKFWMCVNLLDRVSFWGGWFVVSFKVNIPETHSELSRGKSIQTFESRYFISFPVENMNTFTYERATYGR